MKRELAALLPSSEAIRRKTRFSNSDEVSEHLVYKRVKRSSPKAVLKAVEVVETEKIVVEALKVEEKVENGEKTVSGTIGRGKRKKFGAEQYQRRFTRSALKSNDEKKDENTGLEMVVSDSSNVVEGHDEMKGENTVLEDVVKEEKTGLENDDEGITRSNFVEENEEMKGEETGLENGVREDNEEGARRVTRSLLGKGKEDGPDSCVTETSDEEGERVKENVENGNIENVENNGSMAASPEKLLKTVTLERIPLSVMELFETGLLEGCPVYYNGGKGPGLRGRIRAIGICCPCAECCDCKVIAPSLFEIHAAKAYKRAVQYIHLENGRSLIQVLKACKRNHEEESIEETVLNAIGPLPERKVVVCQNCKEQFITIDAECSEPVCASCVMSNKSTVGPVYASRLLRRSSKFGTPQGSISCGKLQDCSLENSVLKITSEGKSAKNSEELVNAPNSCISPTTSNSVATKKSKKLLKKMGKQISTPKVSKIPSLNVSRSSMKKASKTPSVNVSRSSMQKASKTPSVNVSAKKTPGKITRKDIRQHKLVFEDDVLPDGTELAYYAKGKKLLDGYKKGSGIFCNCCENVISASQFESHAGCAARRKPYCYIYTSNGVSLHELSVSLIKGREHSAKFNDDLCSICADGGDLLLCDGCPRAFHTECASLSSIPRGKWYCKYCENMFVREKYVERNANAVAAGRVSGVDPMEQITKRSIRIVNDVGSDVSSCILCSGFDFSKSEFGPRTIILCDQCEKEYHVGCLKDHDMADLKELPDGKWFCSSHCGSIDTALQNLLLGGSKKLPESLVNILTRKNLQNISESAADVDVSWRLLSGKIASPETRPLLSQAVAIFHESFSPISEVVSGHDLIPAMVYGRNAGTQEYGGMHCAVLTVNSVVVSAAIFRVFGPEVAELPLVATSSGNHGKGYFQALFTCIESLLSTLKVKTFVLPAAEEAESIWTKRFGFKRMAPDQLSQLKKNFWSMVRFEGTSMLHKPVPVCEVVQSSGA